MRLRRFATLWLVLLLPQPLGGCGGRGDGRRVASGVWVGETIGPGTKRRCLDPAVGMLQDFIDNHPVDRRAEGWRTRLPAPPKVQLDPRRRYVWDLKTSLGPIRVLLFAEVAPLHAASVAYLTLMGFYDGTAFTRVVIGSMAVAGDPVGDGTGGPGYALAPEVSPSAKPERAGRLVALPGAGGAEGSLCAFLFTGHPEFEGKHSVIGEVVDGIPTLIAIERLGSQGGKPTDYCIIQGATITVR